MPNIIKPQLEPFTGKQLLSISNLSLSCQHAEDALSHGLEKHQQGLVHDIATDPLVVGNFKMDKFKALEAFVNQADYLRRDTLLQMCRILTIGQTAKGLVAMTKYFHHFRI
ncbi:hypothetical protein VNO77_31288 [Canavalia gladiata]|uniref:DOG1 domain-containing protein n=1 Tax=Canavalia gladiata TaxID=3824 RepID=A0AAN9Q4K4_CANGL